MEVLLQRSRQQGACSIPPCGKRLLPAVVCATCMCVFLGVCIQRGAISMGVALGPGGCVW